MARDREAICKYYISFGECQKGRESDHKHYCQKCDKYIPRSKLRIVNKKKLFKNNNYNEKY